MRYSSARVEQIYEKYRKLAHPFLTGGPRTNETFILVESLISPKSSVLNTDRKQAHTLERHFGMFTFLLLWPNQNIDE